MAYARFDDRYDDHRKIRRAWRRFPANPVGLHSQAITYCNRHETDGVIDIDWLEEKVPKAAERERVVTYMLENELLERLDDERFYVHDFLDWNDSREHRDHLRAAGRKGAKARWGNADPNADRNADSSADPSGGASGEANGPPHHTTPEEIATAISPDFSDDVIRLCLLQSDLARRRTDEPEQSKKLLPTKTWHAEMDKLIRIDRRSPEQIEKAIRWVDADPFWSAVVLSVPRLRERYQQLAAAARAQGRPRLTVAEDKNAARRERARNAIGGLMAPTDIEGSVVDDAA